MEQGEKGRRPVFPMAKDTSSSSFSFRLGFRFFRWTLIFVIVVFFLHFVLEIRSLRRFSSISAYTIPVKYSRFSEVESLRSRLRDSVVFLPLKGEAPAVDGEINIITAINDTFDGDQAEHVEFPSPESGGRLLCLAGNNSNDGTKNSYALAWPDVLPGGAAFLPGLTFVSDSFYDYKNLWHGLGAVVPVVAWNKPPARWVLYKKGGLQREMSPWIKAVAEASTGEVRIENLHSPSCFEAAVVFRRNEGRMSRERRLRTFDKIRCKSRALCDVAESKDPAEVRLTLLLRTGTRAFKNETGVVEVFNRACSGDCKLKVVWAAKMESFCEQVKVMSETDVVASPHGAQLTNIIFMDRNSSVMEFFPRGWAEGAGAGQYVYHWLAADSGMKHRGAWRDPEGVDCDLPEEDRRRCFGLFFKYQNLGLDEEHFFRWTRDVIVQTREMKLRRASTLGSSTSCLSADP